jgi:hypothetical protein
MSSSGGFIERSIAVVTNSNVIGPSVAGITTLTVVTSSSVGRLVLGDVVDAAPAPLHLRFGSHARHFLSPNSF